MKILLLGGHGFIGKNLASALEGSGEVISLSRRDGLDLRDLAATEQVFKKAAPDFIFNTAAHVGSVHYVSRYAADVVYDNMQMVMNIYRAVNKVTPKSVIVNPLSNCSYPGDADIHYEPDWFKGDVHESVYAYGNVKKMTYVLGYCYHKQYGIISKNFLVPNVYGPGDYSDTSKTHALNGMIIRMLKAKKENAAEFEVWGTGKPMREWGYVKDMVRILKKALTLRTALIYPVNIAQNEGHSIKEIAEIIKSETGFGGKIVFNKNFPDGAPVKVLDDRKFRKIFPGFKFTPLKKGIRETIKYYKDLI